MKMYQKIAGHLESIQVGTSQDLEAMIDYNTKALGKIVLPKKAEVQIYRGDDQSFNLYFFEDKTGKCIFMTVIASMVEGFILTHCPEEYQLEFLTFLKAEV